MVKTLIIYATDYGNTKKMAESVAAGAKSVDGAQVVVKTAEETTAEDLLSSNAIIFGSPVHMGSPDWRIKKFIDTVCSGLWMKDKLNGKIGGVFASGGGFGSAGGGCELTMLAMLNNCAELGLVMVPLPKNTPGYAVGGLQWGPYGRSAGVHMEQTGVSKESLEAAFHHGANITRLAALTKNGVIFHEPQPAAQKQ
jgi:NAD(P)H dehydrogenase (quinone)